MPNHAIQHAYDGHIIQPACMVINKTGHVESHPTRPRLVLCKPITCEIRRPVCGYDYTYSNQIEYEVLLILCFIQLRQTYHRNSM